MSIMRKSAHEKKLEELKKKHRRLTEEHRELQAKRGMLARELDKFWVDLGVNRVPKTYGEYLHGLISKAEMVAHAKEKDDPKYLAEINDRMSGYFVSAKLSTFMPKWRDDSYSRVSVGHKLTSVLMLTSVPDDIEVKAPWGYWLLEIPDGMYSFNFSLETLEKGLEFHKTNPDADVNIEIGSVAGGEGIPSQIRALLCDGATPKHLLLEVGDKYMVFDIDLTASQSPLLNNFVKGVCLSFDERKNVRESSWARSDKQRRDKLPGYGRQYIFSHTVNVDFREEVKQLLTNPQKHVHTSQWLVRGHWRNQACGPKLQERKQIRIEPYWKGPEEARILLRGHKLV